MKRERSIRTRRHIRPFRIVLVCLFALVVYLAIRIPAMTVQAEKLLQEYLESNEAYYNADAKNNRLTKELDDVNKKSFVEQTARRDFGYVWYGETIYTISNLDELRGQDAPYDFVFTGEDETETEPVTDETGAETAGNAEQPEVDTAG